MGLLASFNQISDKFSFHYTTEKLKSTPRLCNHESHNQFEIFYLLDGQIKYYIEGEEYLVNSGDVLFVSPNEVHSIEILGGENYDRIVVMFDLAKITQALSVEDVTFDGGFLLGGQGFRVIPKELLQTTHIKDIMLDMTKKKDGRILPLYILSKIFQLILELEKIFSRDTEGSFPLASDPIVQKAIAYINQNIATPLTLDQIASAMFVSKSSLCHKFAKSMRISVNRYVTIKKIYYADTLIKQGVGAIEASLAVGYSQYTTFYHNYRKILGTSPTGREK